MRTHTNDRLPVFSTNRGKEKRSPRRTLHLVRGLLDSELLAVVVLSAYATNHFLLRSSRPCTP